MQQKHILQIFLMMKKKVSDTNAGSSKIYVPTLFSSGETTLSASTKPI